MEKPYLGAKILNMKNPILIAMMLFYCVAANAEIKKVVKSVRYEYEINNSDSSEFGIKRWYPHDMDECAFNMCLMNDKLYILDASYKNVKMIDINTGKKITSQTYIDKNGGIYAYNGYVLCCDNGRGGVTIFDTLLQNRQHYLNPDWKAIWIEEYEGNLYLVTKKTKVINNETYYECFSLDGFDINNPVYFQKAPNAEKDRVLESVWTKGRSFCTACNFKKNVNEDGTITILALGSSYEYPYDIPELIGDNATGYNLFVAKDKIAYFNIVGQKFIVEIYYY